MQLVITVALKKEMPADWLTSHNVPVHTLAALRSGALRQLNSSPMGMLVVITGAGLRASKEAACWIRDNINPLFVLNMGTCGMIDKSLSPGKWCSPARVVNEENDSFELDRRIPVPCPGDLTHFNSLLSVKEAVSGDVPDQWRNHDIIDMECFAQAEVFNETKASFHCLKFGTDYSDRNTYSDFNKNLELFREKFKEMISLLDSDTAFQDKIIDITAIVPVYNREDRIQRAIDSILAQTRSPEETIVVDDCSSDKTRGILESYGDSITPVYLPENSGPSKARNEGIKRTRTAWIAFLDSDDCWEKDKLKRQKEFIRKYPFYQIMQSEEKWIRKGKRVNPCKHHEKPEGWIWEKSLERCLVSPSAVLLKKSLLEQYGNFDEDLPVCEDYDLWLKISRHHPVGLSPDFTVTKYGGHGDQLSRLHPAMDRFRVQSLSAQLEKEPNPYFRQKIIHILKIKLDILLKGYEKRRKHGDAQWCREILNTLDSEADRAGV